MDNSAIKRVRYSYLLCIVALGVLLIWCANYFGFWWFTILIGIVIGILIQRGQLALLISLLTGGLGWVTGLIYESFFVPVTRTASLVAEIMGIGNANGWVVITITIVLGILLSGCGAWFSFALKSLTIQRATLKQTQ